MDKLSQWLDEERGRRAKLAAALGITHGAISQWDRVPMDRVIAVSRVTGIAPDDLRPDLADIFGSKPADSPSSHDADRVATAGPDGGPSESGPAFSMEISE